MKLVRKLISIKQLPQCYGAFQNLTLNLLCNVRVCLQYWQQVMQKNRTSNIIRLWPIISIITALTI